MSKNKLFEENMKLVPFTANKYFKAFININKEFKEDIHIRISTIPTVNLSEKNMKEIPSENLS